MISTELAINIRKHAFARELPLNSKLNEMCRDEPSHAFLTNPASQNTYLYLTEYIKEFSERWHDTGFSSMRVLDWGSGKGHVTHLLTEKGASVTSCDIDTSAQDSSFGQRTPIIENLGIHVVPLTHEYLLPFEDESFDVVISMGVLEHVPNERASLCELRRVLRPNGLLFCFYLPQLLSWTQALARMRGDHYHDRLYTKRSIDRLLAHADFKQIDSWRRALLPKNTVRYRDHRKAEAWDQRICANTPLGYLATNIEFVATKGSHRNA